MEIYLPFQVLSDAGYVEIETWYSMDPSYKYDIRIDFPQIEFATPTMSSEELKTDIISMLSNNLKPPFNAGTRIWRRDHPDWGLALSLTLPNNEECKIFEDSYSPYYLALCDQEKITIRTTEDLIKRLGLLGQWKLKVYHPLNPSNGDEITFIVYSNTIIQETSSEIEESISEAHQNTFTIHFKNVEDSTKGNYLLPLSCSKFTVELLDPNGILYDKTTGKGSSSKCSATLKLPDSTRPGYWIIVVYPTGYKQFRSEVKFYVKGEPGKVTPNSTQVSEVSTTNSNSNSRESSTRTEQKEPSKEPYYKSYVEKPLGFEKTVGIPGILLILSLIVGMPLLSAFFLLQGAKIAGIENPTFGKAITAVIIGGIAVAVLSGVIALALPMLLPVGGIGGMLLYLWVVKTIFKTTWDKAFIAWIISTIIGVIVLIGVLLLLGIPLYTCFNGM